MKPDYRIRRERLAAAGFSSYEKYLASPQWTAHQREVWARSGGRCEACRQARGTQVHHFTYARLPEEWPTDLANLCGDCHISAHTGHHDVIYAAVTQTWEHGAAAVDSVLPNLPAARAGSAFPWFDVFVWLPVAMTTGLARAVAAIIEFAAALLLLWWAAHQLLPLPNIIDGADGTRALGLSLVAVWLAQHLLERVARHTSDFVGLFDFNGDGDLLPPPGDAPSQSAGERWLTRAAAVLIPVAMLASVHAAINDAIVALTTHLPR